MSEQEVKERRIRIRKKRMQRTPVQLSSQQEGTVQELLSGHRHTFDAAFYHFSGFRVCECLRACLKRQLLNLCDSDLLFFQPIDRLIHPGNESDQSPSKPVCTCCSSPCCSSASSSSSSSSCLCGSFQKQQSQERKHEGKSSVFTALPHVTDLTTYMIQDIISFSKSLQGFR